MKKIVYNFHIAEKIANERCRPSELSEMLKDAALGLAHLIQDAPEAVCAMQLAASEATKFLDMIVEKEVEL